MRSLLGFLFVCLFFGVVIEGSVAAPPPCTTPNGETAVCVSLFSCPVLHEAIASKDPMVQKFVKDSGCGCQFMVCCGTFGNFTRKPEMENGNKQEDVKDTKESRKDFVLKKLLPTKRFCGMQHTDDYFYNDTVTSVDEFPWVLYLPVQSRERYADPERELKCAGALISKQFALTHSRCADTIITTAKLGQYHRYQTVSCIKTPFNVDDCTLPVVEVEVTNKFTFENSNLLLIKLARKIDYTDFIRPICLPLEDADRPKIGETIITSGWGEEEYGGKTVKIKKRIKHTLSGDTREQCAAEHPFQTSSICAITSQDSKDYVCTGDDGGPLMYKRGNNWFAGGVIRTYFSCIKNELVRGDQITPEVLDVMFEYMYRYRS